LKKLKDFLEISFVDEPAAEDVTGSMVLIKTEHHNILIDAGFYQSNNIKKDYYVNSRNLKNIKVKEIDYIFLSHTHGDHIFLLPVLFKKGCKAKVIVPCKSKNLLKTMLLNCAHINTRDCKYLSKIEHKTFAPLFEEVDVDYCLNFVEEQPINHLIKIDNTFSFKLINSGHIFKGCQIELFLKDNNISKKILYTGDLGNPNVKQPFTEEFIAVKKANYVIGESTYGNRADLKINSKTRKQELMKLKRIIELDVIHNNGRVIIPAFAQARSQTIVYYLYEMFKNTRFNKKIYIDSPLTLAVFDDLKKTLDGADLEKLKELLEWENLVFINSVEKSLELSISDESCIIISSSGMCNHGRVKEHIKNNVGRENTTVVFIGYSAEGTVAEKVQKAYEDKKPFYVDDEQYNVRCKVYVLKSFSSHMPYDDLIHYYTNINAEYIFLHHGCKEAKENLKEKIEEINEEKCKTTKIVVVNDKTTYKF